MALAQPGEWPGTIEPRRLELPAALEHRWRVRLAEAGPRLGALRDRLVLVDASARAGEVDPAEPDPATLDPWRVHRLPTGGFRPAHASDPVFVTDDGEAGRWSPDAGFRRTWTTELPGPAVDAFGLADERLLASSSSWPDGLRLVDERSGAVVWTLATTMPRALAVEDVAVGVRAGVLTAVDLEGGAIRWQRTGVAALAALSEGSAWAMDENGGLLAVDLASGEERARVPLPGRVPRTLLDPAGRLHVLGGALEAAVVDLRDGGRVEWRSELPYELAPARPLLLTTDGRLLLAGADGRLLALRPGTDAPPQELWRTDHVVTDAHAHDGHLYILEEERGAAWLDCLG
jgi:hypothetical protein